MYPSPDFGAEFRDGGSDQVWCTGRQTEVHGGLCLRIDAGVEMKEMVVDRWQLLAGQRIGADSSVVQTGPDGNAAALPPQAREVCGQPLPLPRAAFGLIEMSLARNQSAAPGFETLKLPARSENVGREVGHIAQRPCQQRRHDLFGNARRPVLARDVPGTGDREQAAPGPRIDTKTSRWKVAAQLVKVEDDAQQYCDHNRT